MHITKSKEKITVQNITLATAAGSPRCTTKRLRVNHKCDGQTDRLANSTTAYVALQHVARPKNLDERFAENTVDSKEIIITFVISAPSVTLRLFGLLFFY